MVENARNSDLYSALQWCFEPLISCERESLNEATSGAPSRLLELLESQPLAAFGGHAPGNLSLFAAAGLEAIQRLKSRGLSSSPDTTVSRLFGGVYFSFAQSIALDSLLSNAHSAGSESDTLLAAALSTASSLVNTVGKQFAQPIRPRNKLGELKRGLVAIVARDRSREAFEAYQGWLNKYAALPQSRFQATALRQDYRSAIDEHGNSLSVLYADPPYTRDHYSRFYHVLETMCLRDNPAFSTVVKAGETSVSRGLYRVDRHQSDFCIRSLAPAAFESLFRLSREADLPLVVSYSPHETGDGTHPRVVSMAQIIELANASYKRVETIPIQGSSHNNLNRVGLKLKAREHAEILLLCYR